MKKWMILIVSFLLIVILASIDLMMDIRDDRDRGMMQAQQIAKEVTGWKVISGSRYHGQQVYFIFTMQDRNDELYYVVVDENFQVNYFPQKELHWDQEEIKEVVHNHYQGWKIEAIRTAYVNKGMCWEVLAIDEQNRFHYLYYGMKDGKFIKRYSLENRLRLG
jgi:uncharacterized protein YpmB